MAGSIVLFADRNGKILRSPKGKIIKKNAYRVILTRARQGMVIVVPFGDLKDQHATQLFMTPRMSI